MLIFCPVAHNRHSSCEQGLLQLHIAQDVLKEKKKKTLLHLQTIAQRQLTNDSSSIHSLAPNLILTSHKFQ